jgi:plasmid maintenance system antidote protein VapI
MVEPLPEVFRQQMQRSGQTVAAIARGAGISQPVLHRFYQRKRDLTLRTATKMARYLGLKMRPKTTESA